MDGLDGGTESAGRRADLPGPPEYLAYYNLHGAPFPARVAAGALWLGPARRALLEALAGAARHRRGVLVLTGEAGLGKTSLVNALVDTLYDGTVLVARVGGFGLDAADFHTAVARACGIADPPADRAAFHAEIGQVLDRASGAGLPVLLIIDEAQRLGHDLLAEVHALAVLGSQAPRQLVILLVGQPELASRLLDERHAALARHIAARHVVGPLTPEEVGEYVGHCLRAAGANHDIFSADAIREIARLSRGIPALVGSLCDRALLTGQHRRARTLRRHSIEDSWSTIGAGTSAVQPAPRRRTRRATEASASADPPASSDRAAKADPEVETALDTEAAAASVSAALPETLVALEPAAEADSAPDARGQAEAQAPPAPALPATPTAPPSAFARSAPAPPGAPVRPVARVRGHTRVRPQPVLRRVGRLLVAGLAAVFLVMGGYSLYTGQPTGTGHAPAPNAASNSSPAPVPASPAPAIVDPAGAAAAANSHPPIRAEAGALTMPREGRPADAFTDGGHGARSSSMANRAARPERPGTTEVSGRAEPARIPTGERSAMSRDPKAASRLEEALRTVPSGSDPGARGAQEREPASASPAPRAVAEPHPAAPASPPRRSPERDQDALDAGSVIDWLLTDYQRRNR